MSETPDETNESEQPPSDLVIARSGARLMSVFMIVVALNIAGLLWLAVRANSPASVRGALDTLFQLAVGGSVGFFAFRALWAYPFQLTDLFAMVLVLGAWLKFTIESLQRLAKIGLMPDAIARQEFGPTMQYGLLSASVLVGGGALGLWACKRLSIQRPLARVFTLVPAMLALPAAAGCAAFLVVALGEMSEKDGSSDHALILMICWFASMAITVINTATFIRTVALKAEVKDNENIRS